MGVTFDYSILDRMKRLAGEFARGTAHNLERHGYRELEESRGESAYVFVDILTGKIIAHVEEGLGTEINVTVIAEQFTGRSFFHATAQDNVAMIVNDMITLGALPVSFCMHLAIGDDAWLASEKRVRTLLQGTADACNLAGCSWGGGETPTLKKVVMPDSAVLGGSATGVVPSKDQLMLGSKIRADDAIVLLTGNGIHANGFTTARKIVDEGRLPEGYSTKLSDGRPYYEALLDRTPIYVPVVAECLKRGIDLHYGVNVTGHGWRKFMRARDPFCYVLDVIPTPQPVFQLIQDATGNTDREMYGDYNMGAGFALYLPKDEAGKVLQVVSDLGLPYEAIIAGSIEKSAEHRVIISSKDIEYTAQDLQVR